MISYSEQKLLENIVKSSGESLQDIHTLLGKVYDEELALDLNRQAVGYSGWKEKAAGYLLETGIVPEPAGILERTRRWGFLQARTALNVSTGYIAQMLVKDEEERMKHMEETLWESGVYGEETSKFAEAFMDMEAENIRILKTYC